MRAGVISVYTDYHRRGSHHRGILQPQIGPMIAALLPPDVEVDIVNDTWDDPDWTKHYDLLFIAGLHPDFDRARQISHYWRRRGAKTVYGGIMASTYPHLCKPFFDAIAIGDAEGTIPTIYDDFSRKDLKSFYVSSAYDPARIPVPRFDLAAKKQVIPLSFEVTRGCPFTCEFCALTSIGTRHHVRPIDAVLRDIKEAQKKLRGLVPPYKLYMVVFNDNNIGGNLGYLRELCAAPKPLKLFWGAAITFNALTDCEMVKLLSEAGCRFLFMGLESFNGEAIKDMRKFQNTVTLTSKVIDQCRRYGILVESGLMLSPLIDKGEYLMRIPELLHECGLHIPSFICFESPIPGTPHFHRLASSATPALLPNALLRDFTGYTLVTRPQHASVTEFVEMYKWLIETVYSKRARFLKLADDLPRFLSHGYGWTTLLDLVVQCPARFRVDPRRTYVAGTDTAPPEASSIPFETEDFEFEEERRLILEPWRVTDCEGHVLNEWKHSLRVFESRGRITTNASELVSAVATV